MRTLFRRLLFLLRRDRLTQDIDEELQFHADMKTREYRDEGLTEADARAAARRQVGNALHLREVARDPWLFSAVETFVQDTRHALRLLKRDPTFTLTALGTLALGIGLNTAIVTVAYGVLWRPLPYRNPDRLVAILSAQETPTGIRSFYTWTPEGYLEFSARASTLDDVAGHSNLAAQLTGHGEPRQLRGLEVTPNFFTVLGVTPALGRTFLAGSGAIDDDRSVVISDRLWRSALQSDPMILGRTITLDGLPRTVVGVMPRDFVYRPRTPFGELPAIDVWIQNRWAGDRPHPLWDPKAGRRNAFLWLAGRLKAGIDSSRAQAELTAIMREEAGAPNPNAKGVAQVLSLHEHIVGPVRRLLLILVGAVTFVLLIACVNVANLQMARLSARRMELSIRSALGAGRRRLVRQLLTEAVVLSIAGGVLGVLLAQAALAFTLPFVPESVLPRSDSIGINGWVLTFCLAVSALTSLVVGLLPALRIASSDSLDALHSAGSRTTADRPGERLRTLLVASQVALTLVLLVGAGLLMHSFIRLIRVTPGFEAHGVETVTITLPERLYTTPAQMQTLERTILDRIRLLPGVVSASAINSMPFGSFFIRGDFNVEGQPPPKMMVGKPKIEAAYFKTMGIPVLQGREFTPQDDAFAPKVAIVSETVVRELWPEGDALGRRVRLDQSAWLTVVGVVRDVRHSLDGPPLPMLYVPYQQEIRAGFLTTISFVLRTTNRASVAEGVRAEIRRAAPDLPIESTGTMEDFVSRSVAQPRFRTLLIALFAVAALSIATCGIYGLMAYAVTQRRREIGVRMALGARPRDVLHLVLSRAFRIVAAGVAIGLVASLSVTRLLQNFLFGVTPSDPMAFTVVTLTLIGVGMLAAWLPARRAASIDPVRALRAE
jgi:putative ABC transport system permease protein